MTAPKYFYFRVHSESGTAIYLEDASKADVEEVVRCCRCKFWDRNHISCEGFARCNTGESGVRYRNGNDFCSRGQVCTLEEDQIERLNREGIAP